jgi:hypothetical protein
VKEISKMHKIIKLPKGSIRDRGAGGEEHEGGGQEDEEERYKKVNTCPLSL